jgi:superfamily II DNA or RNA helicase
MPDAAGLVLASDQDAARAYAEIVERVTGAAPALIVSDDPDASDRIARFATSAERIAVCVRMVSEGVDIPRVAALAWLTSYRTPLFFAQAVGRVVRARGRHESATVFLPAVRPLLALAAEMEEERNHVLAVRASDDLDVVAESLERLPADADGYEALDAEAEFAHLLHGGRAVVAADAELTEDDADFVGLPGLLSPEQTAALLARRDADVRKRVAAVRRQRPAPASEPPPAQASWRQAAELRRDVNRLVGVYAARFGGTHAQIHAEIRRAVAGPASASASADILEARRDHLLLLLSR